MSDDEQAKVAIRALIEERAEAMRDKDAARAAATLADDIARNGDVQVSPCRHAAELGLPQCKPDASSRS